MFLPVGVAILVPYAINFLSVIVIVGQCTEYLSRHQVSPLCKNFFYRHADFVVIAHDVPNGDACPLNDRLAMAMARCASSRVRHSTTKSSAQRVSRKPAAVIRRSNGVRKILDHSGLVPTPWGPPVSMGFQHLSAITPARRMSRTSWRTRPSLISSAIKSMSFS